MKTWLRPAAVGQHFAANDYVSACTIEVSCDYHSTESIRNGGLIIPASVSEFADGEYRPCNQSFVIGVNELQQCTFTHHTGGYSGNDPLSTPQTAYYWIQEDGADFHATSVSADQIAAANNS